MLRLSSMQNRYLVLLGTVLISFVYFSPLISFALETDNYTGKIPNDTTASIGTITAGASSTFRSATSSVTIYAIDLLPKGNASPSGINRVYVYCGLTIFDVIVAVQGTSIQSDVPFNCTTGIGNLAVVNSTTIDYIYRVFWKTGLLATSTVQVQAMTSSTDAIIGNSFQTLFIMAWFLIAMFIIYFTYKLFR